MALATINGVDFEIRRNSPRWTPRDNAQDDPAEDNTLLASRVGAVKHECRMRTIPVDGPTLRSYIAALTSSVEFMVSGPLADNGPIGAAFLAHGRINGEIEEWRARDGRYLFILDFVLKQV